MVQEVQPSSEPKGSKSAIRPFRVDIPEAEITELKRRIKATRWPDKETVSDESQGVQFETMQRLAHYWGSEYDWRRCEKSMNSMPQFITEIDGLDIHFIHVRSKNENALPIIITHGWPGSTIEQMKIVDPLVNPTKHGANDSDAFHVVIPSMPGYGFSGKPTTPGWGPERIARAWVTLMKRLGYEKFVAQGGDWGALVVDVMALQTPPELLGIHTNMAGVIPPEISKALKEGTPPDKLSSEEKNAYDQIEFVYKNIGYGIMMGTHPQSLMAISDSPVGLAAFMLDHDLRSYQMIARTFEGKTEGLTRDDVLDNITLTWFTNTALSGARLYWENKFSYFDAKNVTIPVAVSAFADELFQAPKSWTEKAYSKLIYFKKHDKGGHFAAWEQPKLLSDDIREGFRSLRPKTLH